MIIVAKAIQEPNNQGDDYVEAQLPAFRGILANNGCFAYAWTFNPDGDAIAALRRNLHRLWLYLIGMPYYSPVRMKISRFHHSPQRLPCPLEWRQYVPQYPPAETYIHGDFPDWLDINNNLKTIHLWFLVNQVQPINPPLYVGHLTPYFDRKYQMYGRNYFGFFREDEDS